MQNSKAPHNSGDTLRDVHDCYRSYLCRNRDLANHCTQFLKREKSDQTLAFTGERREALGADKRR